MSAFEAVVIGGGHNGLILAAYLAKVGLKTLVLERRLEPGGGLCTEEATIPGFLHNLHSFFHRWVPDLPWYTDLELGRYGVRYIRPAVQSVSPLRDGRCLILHADLERTCRNLAYFSPRDAATYRELVDLYGRMEREIGFPETYAPPLAWAEKTALLEKSSLGREYLRISPRTPWDLAHEHFESGPMRAVLLFLVTTKMFLPHEPGLGFTFASSLTGATRGSMCVGGSHYLGHGLVKVLEANGGRLWEASHVREIVVEGGRARGVILDDGRRIAAEKLVVSAVDAPQTLLDLVAAQHLPPEVVERAKAFSFSPYVLFSVHLALKEPPRYPAASFDPEVDQGLNYNVGGEDPEGFADHWDEIEKGLPPASPRMQCAVPTLHDVTQAPPGRHTAFLWQYAPYHLAEGGPEAWDQIKDAYMECCLAAWRAYAPNLTGDAILAKWSFSPLDVERKLINMRCGDHCVGRASRDQMLEHRPMAGLLPYRTPVENLYLCGSSCHPFGNITGAPGYNAARVILEDLGLPRWWNPPDPRKQWAALRD